MIYDINGTNITPSTTSATSDNGYDFLSNSKNLEGGIGFISGKQINYDGTLKSASGYIVTPLIPIQSLLISDASKITVSGSRVGYYDSSFAYKTKADLSAVYNDGIISGLNSNYAYVCLSLKVSSTSFTITALDTTENLCMTNKYVEDYWNNVEYYKDDYTSSMARLYFGQAYNASPVDYSVRNSKAIKLALPFSSGYDTYTLVLSEHPNYSSPITMTYNVYSPIVSVTNLKINTKYYAKVSKTLSDVTTVLKEWTFTTSGHVRFINCGVGNARDVGGHDSLFWGKVRQGRLFRSARLDDGYSTSVFAQLEITDEIDLRTNDELSESSYTPTIENYWHISCGSSQGLAEKQLVAYQNWASVFKKMVEVLSAGRNLIFHCKGGADRTGIVGAMVGGILGESYNTLQKEYETTAAYNNSTYRNDLDDDGHYWSEAMLVLCNDSSIQGDNLTEKWEWILKQGGVTDSEIESFRREMLTEYN